MCVFLLAALCGSKNKVEKNDIFFAFSPLRIFFFFSFLCDCSPSLFFHFFCTMPARTWRILFIGHPAAAVASINTSAINSVLAPPQFLRMATMVSGGRLGAAVDRRRHTHTVAVDLGRRRGDAVHVVRLIDELTSGIGRQDGLRWCEAAQYNNVRVVVSGQSTTTLRRRGRGGLRREQRRRWRRRGAPVAGLQLP
jgi:hypothetical protein